MSRPRRAALPGSSRHERPNIGILLRIPYQRVVRHVTAATSEAGFDDLTLAHSVVFQHIDAGGSRLTDLAERAQITKQSMGYLIDNLEQRGYLERRPDPTDRRATLICLTNRGWAQIEASLESIAALEEEWARRLGTKRMQQLRELLGELGKPATD
jgi:DNA-binding MarR family transcriptional regulator